MAELTVPVCLLVMPPSASRWSSLNEITSNIAKVYRLLARRGDIRLIELKTGEFKVGELVRLAARADFVVFPLYDRCLIRFLREIVGVRTRLVFYLHGYSAVGLRNFQELVPLFDSGDLFLAASREDLDSTRLWLRGFCGHVLPFPIVTPNPTTRGGPTPSLFVVGRIAQEKNLHTILLALALRQRAGHSVPPVDFYGAEDERGCPSLALKVSRYGARVREMSRELGLETFVRWHGHVPDGEILDRARSRESVLISASVNLHENFGMAAAKHLASGLRATLSDWGGHRELARLFPRQVETVPVYLGRHGPWLDPFELSVAISKTMALKRRGAIRPPPTDLQEVAVRTLELLRGRIGSSVRRPCRFIPASNENWRIKHAKTRDQFYDGYSDKALRAHLLRYGARPHAGTARAEHMVVTSPIAATASRLEVRDLYRGVVMRARRAAARRVRLRAGETLDLRSGTPFSAAELKWLAANGWLVPLAENAFEKRANRGSKLRVPARFVGDRAGGGPNPGVVFAVLK